MRVDPSGKVYVYIGVTAQGQGHATTLAQVAAAELGAAWDDVHVVAGDTALFPFGMGTGGSRVAANSGPAVAQTAREVRERAARVAAECSRTRSFTIRDARSIPRSSRASSRAAPPRASAPGSWKKWCTTAPASS